MKTKQARKLLALALALMMVATLLPTPALADQEYSDENVKGTGAYLTYTVNAENTAVTITGYGGTVEDVVIPNNIGGVPVTTINQDAFRDSGLKRVVLGTAVKTIDVRAFYGCTGLTRVVMPSSVTTIRADAFAGSGLTQVYFSGTMPGTLAEGAFPEGTILYYSKANMGIWPDTFHGYTTQGPVEYPVPGGNLLL